eukprot:2616637-Pleurochrysis_carterae.AAC.2
MGGARARDRDGERHAAGACGGRVGVAGGTALVGAGEHGARQRTARARDAQQLARKTQGWATPSVAERSEGGASTAGRAAEAARHALHAQSD